MAGYENIHGDLTKIELEALSLLEVVQVAEGEISVKVTKEADKIAALDISENLRWLQVCVLMSCQKIVYFRLLQLGLKLYCY